MSASVRVWVWVWVCVCVTREEWRAPTLGAEGRPEPRRIECHRVSPTCHPSVTECHRVSPGATKCHWVCRGQTTPRSCGSVVLPSPGCDGLDMDVWMYGYNVRWTRRATARAFVMPRISLHSMIIP